MLQTQQTWSSLKAPLQKRLRQNNHSRQNKTHTGHVVTPSNMNCCMGLLLMNSFNKTETAVFSCRLCFLRAIPFISLSLHKGSSTLYATIGLYRTKTSEFIFKKCNLHKETQHTWQQTQINYRLQELLCMPQTAYVLYVNGSAKTLFCCSTVRSETLKKRHTWHIAFQDLEIII